MTEPQTTVFGSHHDGGDSGGMPATGGGEAHKLPFPTWMIPVVGLGLGVLLGYFYVNKMATR